MMSNESMYERLNAFYDDIRKANYEYILACRKAYSDPNFKKEYRKAVAPIFDSLFKPYVEKYLKEVRGTNVT